MIDKIYYQHYEYIKITSTNMVPQDFRQRRGVVIGLLLW